MVTGVAVPPSADTRWIVIGGVGPLANRTTPSGLQVPPQFLGMPRVNVCAGPPETAIFFKLLSA